MKICKGAAKGGPSNPEVKAGGIYKNRDGWLYFAGRNMYPGENPNKIRLFCIESGNIWNQDSAFGEFNSGWKDVTKEYCLKKVVDSIPHPDEF